MEEKSFPHGLPKPPPPNWLNPEPSRPKPIIPARPDFPELPEHSEQSDSKPPKRRWGSQN